MTPEEKKARAEDLPRQKYAELSGGQKRLLSLAFVMAMQPGESGRFWRLRGGTHAGKAGPDQGQVWPCGMTENSILADTKNHDQ